MIKILEEGNIPTEKVRCDKCKSLLEYTDDEMIVDYSPDIPFYGQCIDYKITCPKCNEKILLLSLTECGTFDYRIKERKGE